MNALTRRYGPLGLALFVVLVGCGDPCADGTGGAECPALDAGVCAGHGVLQPDGGCACDPGFGGAECAACPTGFVGPACEFSDAVTCHGHGSVSATGACTCEAHFTGTGCQFTDSTTCHGHGMVAADGTCTCLTGYAGATCDSCAAGYAGASCEFSDALTCTGHGVVDVSGACTCFIGYGGASCDACAVGFAGASCEFSDALTCTAHGVVDGSGACTCFIGYGGASCDACAAGFAGASCEFSDALTCTAHGVVDVSGACTCVIGYGGADCATPTLWQGLGGSSWGVPHTTALGRSSTNGYGLSQTTNVSSPSLVLDASDRPVVSFATATGAGGVFLRKWTGTRWDELGGSWSNAEGLGLSGFSNTGTSVGLGPSGSPFVAWLGNLTPGATPWLGYLRGWDGSAWSGLAGSDLGATGPLDVGTWRGNGGGVAMATDPAGYPVVAWQQNSSPGGIVIKRWDGGAWATYGASPALPASAAGHIPFNPALALDAAGNPVVAWQETFGATAFWSAPFQVYLRRWSGTAWVELGGSASAGGVSNTGMAVSPRLAVGADGSVVVTWHETVGTTDYVYLKRWNPASATWSELSGSASGTGIAAGVYPQVAVDAAGVPTVAYVCPNGDSEICLKRWSGAAWVELDGSGSGGGLSHTGLATSTLPQLRLDAAGQPVVVWTEDFSASWTGSRSIYARHFGGTRWQSYWEGTPAPAGSVSGDDANAARGPAMQLTSTGAPVIAWQEQAAGGYSLRLKAWDGASWAGFGASATTGILATGTTRSPIQTRIALDPLDRPVLTWSDFRSGNWDVYLTRWNGTAWADLGRSSAPGGVSNTPAISNRPSVVVDSASNPIVAWSESTPGGTGTDIYVKRWNGTAFVGLGGSATGAGLSGTPALSSYGGAQGLAVDALDHPFVAWREVLDATHSEVYLKMWDGTGWVELGGSATGGGVSHAGTSVTAPCLALDAAGHPVLAWTDSRTGVDQVYAAAWNGTAWLSYSATAVSSGPLPATVSGLSLDASGRPIVVWSEQIDKTNTELYARRWNGSAWVEHGLASATGGGISNTLTPSTSASVAARAGIIGVAWQDWSVDNIEAYYRQIPQ